MLDFFICLARIDFSLVNLNLNKNEGGKNQQDASAELCIVVNEKADK